MRLAAVDIGSNTVHSLVADVLAGGMLRDVAHYVEMPELGPAVARDGEIGARLRRRAVAALRSVVDRASKHDYEHLVAGATAAVRQATDGRRLLEEASSAIETPVRLIDERLEARLSFSGVAMRHHVQGDWLMADLGGGSLELVPARGRQMLAWASLQLGSGTLASRFLGAPPKDDERERLREAAQAVLRQAPDCHPEAVVATGG